MTIGVLVSCWSENAIQLLDYLRVSDAEQAAIFMFSVHWKEDEFNGVSLPVFLAKHLQAETLSNLLKKYPSFSSATSPAPESHSLVYCFYKKAITLASERQQGLANSLSSLMVLYDLSDGSLDRRREIDRFIQQYAVLKNKDSYFKCRQAKQPEDFVESPDSEYDVVDKSVPQSKYSLFLSGLRHRVLGYRALDFSRASSPIVE